MKGQALAIANNDLVYLWWTYPEKIRDCLGFTIRRHEAGMAPVALPAFVGFTVKTPDAPAERRTTDYWPIQSYQWKDLFVPEEHEVSYEIVPVKGTPGEQLEDLAELAVMTEPIVASDRVGKHRVIFNRGIISTQAVSRALPEGEGGNPSRDALVAHIWKPGDEIRERLAGEATGALISLLARARRYGGTCFCALYELTDRQLKAEIIKSKGHVQLILSNADDSITKDGKQVKVYDLTNSDTRAELHLALDDAIHDRLLPKGNYIGHNKFVVYVDDAGTPRSVVTGSTNWTPTGLCAQSNNVLVLNDGAVAQRYLDYWNALLADDAKQAPALRKSDMVEPPKLSLGEGQGQVQVWYSPNTERKTKPAKNPPAPPDMKELFDAIGKAEHGVLFLLFSAGAPSILERLSDEERDRRAAGRELFVRGAISDLRTAHTYATRVYNDSLLEAPNVLVTGIGGVQDQFSYWEEELASLGHAVIHDKIVVIDPFSDNCLVATGSHNLGFKASYSNDENLCLIRGNRAIAHAYAAHVLDIVNHYNWRYNLPPGNEKAEPAGAKPKPRFDHLANTAAWQNKYFRGDFLASRDRFFFPAAP